MELKRVLQLMENMIFLLMTEVLSLKQKDMMQLQMLQVKQLMRFYQELQ